MLIAIVSSALAVLSTVVGAWDRLTGVVRKSVVLGVIAVAIALASQVVQLAQKKGQMDEIARQQRLIEDASILLESNLLAVDEASGGAMDGDTAYVVDDDEPGIFVFQYVQADRLFKLKKPAPIEITDARPCGERATFWPGTCNESAPYKLKRQAIEDLEAAAIYNQRLYLAGAQSTAMNGDEEMQRQLFLELDFDGKVLRATRLRQTIRGFLEGGLPSDRRSTPELIKEGMHLEGLAIDATGLAYLGFRAPDAGGLALVLRIPVERIFSDLPTFDAFFLDLQHNGNTYGIVSMEYDSRSKTIQILGNSPWRDRTLPPAAWTWQPGAPGDVQHPTVYRGDLFARFDAPGSRPAKPEVILLPSQDHVHMFFDAEGTGGQIGFTRTGTELLRAPRQGLQTRESAAASITLRPSAATP